jgi:hypothetical protein
MKHLLSVIGLGLAILAAPALAATDVTSPQGLLKGQLPDNTAALKRVAITTFFVQYVTDFGIETKRKGGGTFFSKWKGPPPEVLQAATDALYVQLVADLKAAGMEVVANDELAAQAAMADLRKAARPSPATVNDSSIKKVSTLVAAQNLPLVLASLPDVRLSSYATRPLEGTDGPGNLVGWDKQSSQWLLGSNMELMSLGSIHIGQAKIAQGANAIALNVRLTIPLVDMGITTAGNAGGGFFGAGKTTGLIKPNARFVEAGTVFSFAHGGQQAVLGLQTPVPITGLKVTTNIDKVSLDETIFGKQSARGSGLLGLLNRSAGGASEDADFWVSFDAAELQPALVSAGSTIFKELAQVMAGAK